MKADVSKSLILLFLLALLPAVLDGCMTTDDARVLQLLNERGFGRKYTGNANEVFYFGIGDTIKFTDKDNPELRGNAKIAMDGTVNFPQLGETYVAGLTAKEIANMLNMRLGHYYKYVNISVTAGPVFSKRIFIQLDNDKQVTKKFQGDQTVFDVIQSVKYDSILVDLDNIKVIRADPVHPLVIYCDMDDMIDEGYSRDNILVKEDDIIYFTPSIIGYIVRFVKVLVAPLKPIAQLFTAARQIDYMYESFGEPYYYGGRGQRWGYY